MIDRILATSILLGSYCLCGCILAAEQETLAAGRAKEKAHQYSALAKELIGIYTTPPKRGPGPFGYHPTNRPPPLSKKHVNEEYRLAWEELLLIVASRVQAHVDPSSDDFKVVRIKNRVFEALAAIADPASVPCLAQAFASTTQKDVDQRRAIGVQREVLLILYVICDADALEAILTSLDLADESYGKDDPERIPGGQTLREMIFSTMLQPDNLGRSDLQKEDLERAGKWQALLGGYLCGYRHGRHEPPLSKKNEELLSSAKAFKRPKREDP